MFKNITSLCFSIALAITLPTILQADEIPPSYTPSIHQIIVKQAQVYATDPLPILKVARCESSLDIHAIGDHGHAFGILQFHQQTFDQYAKVIGIQSPNINDPVQQAQVASYMFSIHKQSAWTCAKKVGIIK